MVDWRASAGFISEANYKPSALLWIIFSTHPHDYEDSRVRLCD